MSKKFIIILSVGILLAIILVAVLLTVFRASNGMSGPGGVSDFLPFGLGGGDRTFPDGAGGAGGALNEPGDSAEGSVRTAPAIQKITATPVAAAMPFMQVTEAGTTTMVRYTDRGSGHILEANLEILEPTPVKIANTTIPRVQQGYWAGNASTTLYQYLDDERENAIGFVGTMTTPPDAATTTGAMEEDGEPEGPQYILSGRFIPVNAYGIAFAPDASRLFYLLETSQGTAGYLAQPDGSALEAIFTSPLTELTASWTDPATILITTRAAATAPGFSFTLDPVTGADQLVLGGLSALSALASPDGAWILYFARTDGTPSLNLLNRDTRVSTRLSVVTLPEKCTWSRGVPSELWCAVPASIPPANYPDSWYQGVVTHRDTFWHIVPATGSTNQISIESAEAVAVDATQLTMSPNQAFITFINKVDGALWSLRTNLNPVTPTDPAETFGIPPGAF